MPVLLSCSYFSFSSSFKGLKALCQIVTWAFCFLAFLRVSASGATVFGYFVNLVSLFGGLVWMSICVSHIRFVNAFAAQGLDRSTLTYRAPFGKYGSWVALICTAIVCFFKGWDAFVPSFTISTFVRIVPLLRYPSDRGKQMTNYIGVVTFVGIYAYHKLRYRTKIVPLDQVDLVSVSYGISSSCASPDVLLSGQSRDRYVMCCLSLCCY